MNARRVRLVLLWAVPVGVLGQGALAGQAWFLDPGLFGLHGGIGHGVLGLAVIAAALSWTSRADAAVRWGATTVVALLVAQTGLGYTGHRSGIAVASAVHVPLGLLILGLAVATAVLALMRPVDAGRRPS